MDRLQDFKYTLDSCNSCGQCRFILGPMGKGWDYAEICPIYSRFLFESYSGQGLINIAQELLEGTLQYDDDLIKHIYLCTTCGACDVNCKSVRDMEVMDTILALREKCVEDGQGPMPEHLKWTENIKHQHNIFGRDHSRRFAWLPDDYKFPVAGDTAYFCGCRTAFQYPEIALNTLRILEAAGISCRLMKEEEFCCGAPLWRTGQTAAAQKLAEHNLQVLKKSGIKRLIFSCAECCGTFKGFYPRLADLDIQLEHITEVVHRALQEKRLQFTKTADMQVTYHDPCLLGRLSEKYVPWSGEIGAFGRHVPTKIFRRGTEGVYDAPRKILQKIPGIKLVEMNRHAENAFCCGGGGGVLAAFPEFAAWTAGQRLTEAASTGAEAVVSACPLCQETLQKAISNFSRPFRYYDITDLIARAIRI